MHNYSRNMPPAPPSPPLTWGDLIVMYTLAAGLLYLLYLFPVPFLLCCAGIAVLCVYASINTRRYVARLAVEREGESTCTFARWFDYRRIDPWIIRAVYEELQRGCTDGRRTFPLRGTDRLDHLLLDLEDLWDNVVPVIAYRAGRSLEDAEQNPLFGKVVTVGGLVLFLSYQPKKAPTAQEAVH